MSTGEFIAPYSIHSSAALLPPFEQRAALALGGGGARGIAHLGAMEVIGESGVQTERIVGVSIGSLMGGLYAAKADIRQAQAETMQLLDSPVFSKLCQSLMASAAKISSDQSGKAADSAPVDWFGHWVGRMERIVSHGHRLTRLIRGPSVLTNEILNCAIKALIPDIDISETVIPFSVVAVDLISGHPVVLERGSLRSAILASTAIPGIFPPVRWEDPARWEEMLLCDIGILDAIPLSVAKSYGSELTIGVDVGSTIQRMDEFDNAIDVVMRMEEIGEKLCRRHSIRHADVLIRPDVGDRPWYDLSDPHRLIEAGRKAARRALARRSSNSSNLTQTRRA